MRSTLAYTLLALALGLLLSLAPAVTAEAAEAGVTRIHLDPYNGYFAARETLAGLEPGTYEFVIANKAGKLVGFQIENAEGRELDTFPIEPGQTRTTRVEIGEGGFRYRCPINPTPWYDVQVGA